MFNRQRGEAILFLSNFLQNWKKKQLSVKVFDIVKLANYCSWQAFITRIVVIAVNRACKYVF